MMARKTLLFLSAAHCHACTWQDGELSAAKDFADNADGREQFAAFLQAQRAPALLLTDLIEEDFRLETVPHLRGSEHRALIRRKLEQYYRNTPFRQARIPPRRKDGRNENDMLFSALTNPALISPWLNIMLAHNVALAGIYSVPHISTPLVQSLSSTSLLLLSWEKHAGLRQTFIEAGQLRFSRLTSMHDSNSFGAAAATEAVRTQQYLKNLGLLPPGSPLNAHIICHANDRRELEAQLNSDAELNYSYLDLQELGQRAGSKMIYVDSDATPLFLHLLASHPPRSHYAAAEHTRHLRLTHIRRALHGLGATLAAGCLLWAATNIVQGLELEQESQSIKAQARQLAQQAQQISREFPGAQAPASDMKTAVLLARKLDGYSPPPQTILADLATTLDDFPDVRIDKLSWQTNADTPLQEIVLDGELEKFNGDYRGALAHLEHFRQALIESGHSATALSLPLDLSPQGSIDAAAVDGGNQPALFSLKLSRSKAT